MKVCFCLPTIKRPYQQCLDSLEASVPLVKAAGWDDYLVSEVGNPYISSARNTMLRKALDAKADVIVFIDHDLSWEPANLVKLLDTEGDIVAGTYRFKDDGQEEYMGYLWPSADGRPIGRADGCVRAEWVPAGFLKVTAKAIDKFMTAYPDLCYGPKYTLSVDLFNHGAHKGIWYGEDYAFSRNWNDAGGEIWVIPDLNLTHWNGDKPYPGNYHEWLLRRPGGSKSANPQAPA